MINPHKGEISFESNGQRYVLQYSIDAICTLEGETGKGIVALATELEKSPSMTLMRQLIWAGLLEHHPDMTLKEAGELILAAGGLVGAMSLFNKAFAGAFEKQDEKPRPRKAGSPKNGIGPHSTATGAASSAMTSPSGERRPAKSP
jgi:hypothetical protein